MVNGRPNERAKRHGVGMGIGRRLQYDFVADLNDQLGHRQHPGGNERACMAKTLFELRVSPEEDVLKLGEII